MAAPTRSMTRESESLEVRSRAHQGEGEGLTQLFSRLGDDVMQLVNNQLTLLKVELRDDARAFATSAALIGMGAAIALVGFALVNVAVAFGVSTLFAGSNLSEPAQFALGFVITGFFYVIVGGVIVAAMKSRLSKIDMVPERTVEELRKDKQWLKNEL
jgi:uncharacterized membrane protein YqjE